MMVRQPLCVAVGKTHAESVMAVVTLSEAELLTTTRLLVPLKLSALPYRPSVDHVAPEMVPVLLLSDASATVVPVPSLKPQAATGPEGGGGGAGSGGGGGGGSAG